MLFRSGYPAETAAPSPLPTEVPGVPGLRPALGRGPGPCSQTQGPQPHHTPAFGVPPPNPGLSLCRSSSWAALPAAKVPSSPALGPCLPGALGLRQQEDGPPLRGLIRGTCTSPSPWGRKPGQPSVWSPTWGKAKPGWHSISARQQQTRCPGDGGGSKGEQGRGGREEQPGTDVDGPLANTTQESINC